MYRLANNDNELNELRMENTALRRINEQLEQRLCSKSVSVKEKESVKSVDVEQYIDELLQDESINIQYLPDIIERQLYRNVLGLTVNLLRKISQDTSLNVLGHSIRLVFE